MQVRIIAKTEGISGTEYATKSLDEIIVGIARLSSSREINELFEAPDKLLRYCLMNGHWSVFSTTNMVIEIITSRAMARELLRHWTLRPQELSQRYAEIQSVQPIELRKQSENNRQSSTEVINPNINDQFADDLVGEHIQKTLDLYKQLLDSNVSRETARFILPEAAETKIIFNGTIREWITTLNLRLHNTTQKEARLVAIGVKDILLKECPIISKALYNFEDADKVHILDRLILEKYNCYQLVKDNDYKKLRGEE